MKPLHELSKQDLLKIKLIVLDVDGVLVPRGTVIEQKNNRTMFETKRIEKEEIALIKELHERYTINISSGRSLFMLMDMFREILPYVSLTYENGSATWFNGKIHQHYESFNELFPLYRELDAVDDRKIKGYEPKEFIITIHCTDRVTEIEDIVSRHQNLYCLWNGEAYDIGVKNKQTKGIGLRYLIQLLGIQKENVIAIGDNLNDRELLDEAGIKISADKTRVNGDFYVPLPAETLLRILSEQ